MENNFVPEVFLSEKFGELRIAEIDDKPYFCGIDVAKALGYSNPRDAIGRHCKQNGVVKHDTISGPVSLRAADLLFITTARRKDVSCASGNPS